jgi:hypothetical protein
MFQSVKLKKNIESRARKDRFESFPNYYREGLTFRASILPPTQDTASGQTAPPKLSYI